MLIENKIEKKVKDIDKLLEQLNMIEDDFIGGETYKIKNSLHEQMQELDSLISEAAWDGMSDPLGFEEDGISADMTYRMRSIYKLANCINDDGIRMWDTETKVAEEWYEYMVKFGK